MTKHNKNVESIRQKLSRILRNKDGFSFIEVIIVIAMILILTAILIPSYMGFVETARESNVKISAQNMYTTIQMANLNLDNLETSQELYDELKELNPALIGVGAYYDVDAAADNDPQNDYFKVSDLNEDDPSAVSPLTYEELLENSCAIGDITLSDNGYSFTYYQYMNSKLYIVSFDNGSLGKVKSYSVAFPEENSSSENEDPFA